MAKNLTKPVFLAFLFSLLISVSSFTYAQTRIGIKAGVNFSNVMMEDEDGNKANTKSMPGIRLGLTADIPLKGDFYLQPAILYSRKGFKQETGGFYGSATNFEVKAFYMEVPLNILYKPGLGSGHLLVGAGPYIGYGTGGNWKSEGGVILGDMMIGDKGDVIFRNNSAEGGGLESYTYGRPLDYGANFLFGYEFLAKLSVQLNAQLGVANLKTHFDGFERESKLKNTGFGISFGYKF